MHYKEEGMYLVKGNIILQESRTIFFRNAGRNGNIDENMFNMWKVELQKELPSFWESMNKF